MKTQILNKESPKEVFSGSKGFGMAELGIAEGNIADTSSFSTGEYAKHISLVFLELHKNGLSYKIARHINALVPEKESHLFNATHATWIYQNYHIALGLLKNNKSRKLFQLLIAAEDDRSYNKSINKLRKEIKTSPANMWHILNKFRELNLIAEPETQKGEPKIIRLNLKDYEVIIRALNIMLVHL
mgnify:CR=1 FL=1